MAPRNKPQSKDNGHDEDFSPPEGFAGVLFDKGFSLNEEYERVVKQRKANRESLRNLEVQGLLSPDEVELLNEMYPVRARKGEDASEDTPEPLGDASEIGTPEPVNA